MNLRTFGSVQDVSELVRALASLAWPAVALTALLMFRGEVAALIKRLRRGRAAGLEFDFDRELNELQQSAEEADEAVPPRPAVTPGAEVAPDEPRGPALDILDRASESPKAALMALSAEIERRSREVLSTRSPEDVDAPLTQQLGLLDLSPAVREAAEEFRVVRNRIVHGGKASNDEALRAIDAGIAILSAIERIPHGLNVVIEPKVDCFADADGTRQHEFQAVLLGAEHPPDGEFTERAFPQTGVPLPKGEPVTWEWISGRVFPETWIRDPRTGEMRYAWTSSLEFAGQPLHDLERGRRRVNRWRLS